MSVTQDYKILTLTHSEYEAVRAALAIYEDQCNENYCFRCTKENGEKLAAARSALAKEAVTIDHRNQNEVAVYVAKYLRKVVE
ncbi:hypothetical protein [Duganella radicis]|uniref:Uncharacterized protein n=1 Tax=Duganella radicis TaxID=551988 RepID=A0A6L6PB23_9BURK|nr:hypothetical protein [Duganella radicis]MTV36266.1 hypothetical protein [Duganella radicis]